MVGKPDEALGEIVAAFVVIRGGALDLDDVRSFLAGHVAAYKLPAELHVIEQIPRTGSGKIKRHELRERLPSDVGR